MAENNGDQVKIIIDPSTSNFDSDKAVEDLKCNSNKLCKEDVEVVKEEKNTENKIIAYEIKGYRKAVTEGNLKDVEKFIKGENLVRELFHKEDVEELKKLTPFHIALILGDLECIKLFLKNPDEVSNLASEFKWKQKQTTVIDYIINDLPRSEEFLKEIMDMQIKSVKDVANIETIHNIPVELNYEILSPKHINNQMLVLVELIKAIGKHDGSILLHPLIQSFLYLMWKKLKYYYRTIVLLYAVIVVLISWLILRMYESEPREKNLLVTIVIASFISLLTIVEVMLFISVMIKRSVIICLKRPIWTLSLCSKTLMMMILLFNPDSTNDHITKMITATAAILSYLEIVNLIAHFPEFKSMCHMFTIVMGRAAKVFVCFGLFIIVGFSMAFWVIFHGKNAFYNLFDTIIRTIVMTSEFDFVDLYQPFEDDRSWQIAFKLIFVIFIFFVPIVLMNLTLGLIINDINNLEFEGEIENTKKHIMLMDTIYLIKMALRRRVDLDRTLEISISPGKYINQANRDLPLELEKTILKMCTSSSSCSCHLKSK